METITTLAYGIAFSYGNDYNAFLSSIAEKLTPYQQKRFCALFDVWEDESYEELEEYEQEKLDSIDLSGLQDKIAQLGNYSTEALMNGYLQLYYPTLSYAQPFTGHPLVVFNESSRRIINGGNGSIDVTAEDTSELERFLSDHNVESVPHVIFWTEDNR